MGTLPPGPKLKIAKFYVVFLFVCSRFVNFCHTQEGITIDQGLYCHGKCSGERCKNENLFMYEFIAVELTFQ